MTNGRFGIHGGQYMPEVLMKRFRIWKKPTITIKMTRNLTRTDSSFKNMRATVRPFTTQSMTNDLGGAKIYFKREDLNHTGAHKINNVLGQCLLGKENGQNLCNR